MKLTFQRISKKTELQTAKKLGTGVRWALACWVLQQGPGYNPPIGKELQTHHLIICTAWERTLHILLSLLIFAMFFTNRNKTKHINLLFLRKAEVSLLGKHRHSTKPYVCFQQLDLKLACNTRVCSKNTHKPENRSFTSSVLQTKGDIDLWWFPPVKIVSATSTPPTFRRIQPFFLQRGRTDPSKNSIYTQKNDCNIKEMHRFKQQHSWLPSFKIQMCCIART